MKTLPIRLIIISMVLIPAIVPAAQTRQRAVDTPAYLILVLQKVKVETALQHLRTDNTETSLPVIRKREELQFLISELTAMHTTGPNQVAGLTENYGKLILRKVTLLTELAELRRSYIESSPMVKEKQYELTALTNEIVALMKEQ
jgi:hypothetical protein